MPASVPPVPGVRAKRLGARVSVMPQPRTLPAPGDVTASLLTAVAQDRADLCESVHGGLVQSVLAARYLVDLLTPRVGADAATAEAGAVTTVDVRWQMLRDAVSAAVVEGRGLLARLKPVPGERELPEALAALADARDGVELVLVGTWSDALTARLPAGGADVLFHIVRAALEHGVDSVLGRGGRVCVVAASGPGDVRVELRTHEPVHAGPAGPGAPAPAAGAGEERWGPAVGAWAACLTALGGRVDTGPDVLSACCPVLDGLDGLDGEPW